MGVIFLAWLAACNNRSPKFSDKNIEAGFQLAQSYCKSCHQFPEPALLDKITWANHVLPKMGKLAGFRYKGLNKYTADENATFKLEEWNKITQYYISQSPAELPAAKPKTIEMGLKQFLTQKPAYSIHHPVTTMVSAGVPAKNFFFGDGVKKMVYQTSPNNKVTDSFMVGIGVSDLHISDTSLLALTMGVLQPSDIKAGKLVSVNRATKQTTILLDSLQRPVSTSYIDLNHDAIQDIIVCEFGNNAGMLSWYQGSREGKYIKHILRALPGAVQTEVHDFNKDGRPDIMAMMAQGDEGIFIYFNQGDSKFKEERILQLPPSYGSNYFELADFNKDGYMDILATNGDNGDYSPILKAYHGIRIYLNDGKNIFKETTFLQVNGVGKAIAKDFDEDGDLDIASIAFFPDYKNRPEENFIYWENRGNLSFNPSSFSDTEAGRWITMDAGDIDGDGDLDLILGNAYFSIGDVPPDFKAKWDVFTSSILILKNSLR